MEKVKQNATSFVNWFMTNLKTCSWNIWTAYNRHSLNGLQVNSWFYCMLWILHNFPAQTEGKGLLVNSLNWKLLISAQLAGIGLTGFQWIPGTVRFWILHNWRGFLDLEDIEFYPTCRHRLELEDLEFYTIFSHMLNLLLVNSLNWKLLNYKQLGTICWKGF